MLENDGGGRDYKRELCLKLTTHFKGLQDDYYTNVVASLHPTSKELENCHNSIAQCMYVLTNLYEYDPILGTNYTREKNQNTYDLLSVNKESLDFNEYLSYNDELVLYHSDIKSEIRNIYNYNSDEYFKFDGKSTLGEIFRVDCDGYLEYDNEIISIVNNISPVIRKVNTVNGFRCSDEEMLNLVKSNLEDLKSKMEPEAIKTFYIDTMNELYKEIAVGTDDYIELLDPIISDVNMSISNVVDAMVGSLYRNFIDDMINEINNVEPIPETIKGEIETVKIFSEMLEDINIDLQDVINDINNINYTDRATFVNEFVNVTKDNYKENGELKTTEFSDDSVFGTDADFLSVAEERAQVDILFDLGLIDDTKVSRNEVTFDNVFQYADINDFDLEKVEGYANLILNSNSYNYSTSTRKVGDEWRNYDEAEYNEFQSRGNTSHNEMEMFNDALTNYYNSYVTHVYQTGRDLNVVKTNEIITSINSLTIIINDEKFRNIRYVKIDGGTLEVRYNNYYVKSTSETTADEASRYLLNDPSTTIYATYLTDDPTMTSYKALEAINDFQIQEIEKVLKELGYDLDNMTKQEIANMMLAIGDEIISVPGLGVTMTISELYHLRQDLQAEKARFEDLEEKGKISKDSLGKIEKYQYIKHLGVYVAGSVNLNKELTSHQSPIHLLSLETLYMQEAIEKAYIISQGAEAVGYEEAMQWSYDLAVANGYYSDYATFSKEYSDNMSQYQEELGEMRGQDIDWMVESYQDYDEVFYEINTSLRIITN